MVTCRVRVPRSNHLRASSVSPMSVASWATDWYRNGFGFVCVRLMPCSQNAATAWLPAGWIHLQDQQRYLLGAQSCLMPQTTDVHGSGAKHGCKEMNMVPELQPQHSHMGRQEHHTNVRLRTFIHRSRARMRLPCRFSSSPQPCHAAACSGSATVAASYSLRASLALPCFASRYAHAVQMYAFLLSAAQQPDSFEPGSAEKVACVASLDGLDSIRFMLIYTFRNMAVAVSHTVHLHARAAREGCCMYH